MRWDPWVDETGAGKLLQQSNSAVVISGVDEMVWGWKLLADAVAIIRTMDIECDSNHCLIFVKAKRSNDSQQTSKQISGQSLSTVVVYPRIVQSPVGYPYFPLQYLLRNRMR